MVDTHLRDLAILLAIALLFTVNLYALSLRVSRQRELEEELGDAHTEIAALRLRLNDATRPPTQFARMRMREIAVDRFVRLRLATPRRSRLAEADRVRDRTH